MFGDWKVSLETLALAIGGSTMLTATRYGMPLHYSFGIGFALMILTFIIGKLLKWN